MSKVYEPLAANSQQLDSEPKTAPETTVRVSNQLYEQAKYYVSKSLSIFPAKTKKEPLVKWKSYQSEKPDEREIRVWCKEFPDALIAIVTGKLSNLTVIDCDNEAAVNFIEKFLPEGLNVPKVSTPHGGRHYWFCYSPELKTKTGYKPGIDVRSEGGYVLAPPSKTEDGAYRWVEGSSFEGAPSLPSVPDNIKNFLLSTGSDRDAKADDHTFSQGKRDTGIFRTAHVLAKAGIPKNTAYRVATDIARQCDPPFPHFEAKKKVDSAFSYVGDSDRSESPNQPGLGTFTLDELLTKEIADSVPLVFPVLSEGDLVVFSGPAKLGKSMLSLNLALSLAAGIDWLSFDVPTSRKVLIIQQEVRQKSLQKRVLAMLSQEKVRALDETRRSPMLQNIVMNSERGVYIDSDEGYRKIVAAVEEHEPALLIIDPLAMFHTKKENSAGEMSELMARFQKIIDKYGIAILLVHHFGKPNQAEREGGELHRGSSVIGALSDANWTFQRVSSNRYDLPGPRQLYAKFGFELRNHPTPPEFIVGRDANTLWYDRVAVEDKRAVTSRDVVELVRAKDGISQKDIVRRLLPRASARLVKEAIYEAEKERLIFPTIHKGKGSPKTFALKGEEA